MEIKFTERALADLLYWKEKNDKNIQEKIAALLQSIQNDPFRGIGKPEPLRFNRAGCWSRRINKEHRLVYQVENNVILIHSLRFHYD